MVDSIDFIIRGIKYVDFKYLRKIGINDIKTFFSKDGNGNGYRGYSWSYKGIGFKFDPVFENIIVITNIHTILDGKMDITLSDKEIYKRKISKAFNEVFAGIPVKFDLYRIDYYVDVELEEELIQKYVALYRYYMPTFARTKTKKIYATSVHRTSKKGQYNLNVYSKFAETLDEKYKGIFRLELQVKKAKLESELKRFGIPKEIDYYWTQDAMEEYYFNFLRFFFGNGKHMKYREAKKLINKANYSAVWKKKLKNFLKGMMENLDYRKVVKTKKTFQTYTEKLGALNINVLCMFEAFEPFFPNVDGLDNLLDLAYATAKEKYFK